MSADQGAPMSPDRTPLADDELHRLLAVGRALVSELDLESVLDHVLQTAVELTNARYAALGILDESKDGLERFLHTGLDEEARRRIGPLPRGRGVLGELIRDPRPLRLADVTTHPRSYGFPPGHPPMATFLGVPITIRGEAYGNLYLAEKAGGGQFSERDEQLVVVLADWASIAIDNARLYKGIELRRDELERAVRGLEATSAIARAVGFETDLERVLELIAKRGRAMSQARAFLVLLQDAHTLRVAAAAGEIDRAVLGAEVPESSLAVTALTTGTGELVVELDSRIGHGLDDIAPDASSALAVPLGFRGRGQGVLIALDSLRDDPSFDSEDQHLLASFASSAAIAIATAQSVSADRLRLSIRAAENERTRWARELHDETLQELGAFKVALESVRQAADPSAAMAALDRSIEHVDLSIRNLQGLITELRPAALDELGLRPALEALLERTSATSGMVVESEIRLEENGAAARLGPELESTVYRLVQETLTNTVKHANAERVELTLKAGGGEVRLSVSDDGSGFLLDRPAEGFGLIGMRERVELVGGRLEVESSPGGGTVVRARLPVRPLEQLVSPPAGRDDEASDAQVF